VPDEPYLKVLYRLLMGKKLSISNPKTFNEKLQWLKIHDHNKEYTKMVDKYEVKEYVASVIGDEYVIPTIGIYNTVEDIEWDKLPNKFVLKTTHGGGSGGVIICKDKSSLILRDVRIKLRRCLKQNIYNSYREWPYKNVTRRILVEEFIAADPEVGDLYDYKFFCFNGTVKCFKIDFDRTKDHHANYYDREGNLLPFGEEEYPPIPQKLLMIPSNLEQMIELAQKLAFGMRFARIDFYNVKGRIYFGEITLYPAGGMGKFIPEEWDTILGDMISL
jgi:hypothetical protein